jgi:hypothetical protein
MSCARVNTEPDSSGNCSDQEPSRNGSKDGQDPGRDTEEYDHENKPTTGRRKKRSKLEAIAQKTAPTPQPAGKSRRLPRNRR